MVTTAHDANQKMGYKQTEVGVIPEDWAVKKLRDIAPLKRGFDLPTSYLKDGIYPVVYSNGVLNYHSSFKVKAPGVVTGRSGTIGKVNYVEYNYWPHNTSLWVTDFKGNTPKFIYYLYTYLKLEQFGTGSGVPTLNRNDVHAHEFPLPPPLEQTAIATDLSDVDALIASLDKLIAKKRDIKQATMQQLLTGKRRLPGFSGEWKVKKLGDDVEAIIGGGTPSRSKPEYWGGNISWVTVKDFATFDPYSTQESITNAGLQNSASNLIKKGTIITSTRMAIGKAVIYGIDVSINQDLKAIFLKRDSSTLFMFYWFEQNATTIENLGSGSTVKGISLSDLKDLSVQKPPTITEQQAIATVLSDMDAEIVALERRRDKTRALKQGMMQELLTGKTRLV